MDYFILKISIGLCCARVEDPRTGRHHALDMHTAAVDDAVQHAVGVILQMWAVLVPIGCCILWLEGFHKHSGSGARHGSHLQTLSDAEPHQRDNPGGSTGQTHTSDSHRHEETADECMRQHP